MVGAGQEHEEENLNEQENDDGYDEPIYGQNVLHATEVLKRGHRQLVLTAPLGGVVGNFISELREKGTPKQL